MNETLRLTVNKLIALDGIGKQDLANQVGMPYATLAGMLNGTRNGSVASWETLLAHFGFQMSIGISPII